MKCRGTVRSVRQYSWLEVKGLGMHTGIKDGEWGTARQSAYLSVSSCVDTLTVAFDLWERMNGGGAARLLCVWRRLLNDESLLHELETLIRSKNIWRLLESTRSSGINDTCTAYRIWREFQHIK
jgi:hypothetical protein